MPTNTELMDRIERVMARNLRDYVIALRQDVPELGAASIDVAGGVAAFSGAGSPLSTVKGAHAELSRRELETIESFFRGCGSRVVTVEVAPWPVGDVAELLLHFGYAPSGTEDVVVACGPSRGERIHSVEPVSADSWRRLMLSGDDASDPLPRQLVAAAARLPHATNYVMSDGGRFIAGAQSVLYDEFAVFGNDETKPEARRRGAQSALIAARLDALPPGVRAIAEVAPGSTSERNYLRRGFEIAYTRQHYTRLLP